MNPKNVTVQRTRNGRYLLKDKASGATKFTSAATAMQVKKKGGHFSSGVTMKNLRKKASGAKKSISKKKSGSRHKGRGRK